MLIIIRYSEQVYRNGFVIFNFRKTIKINHFYKYIFDFYFSVHINRFKLKIKSLEITVYKML